MTAQCEGMGEVGSVRYEPALLPPCPSIRVLSYSNCQEMHSRQQAGLAVQVLITDKTAGECFYAPYQLMHFWITCLTEYPEYQADIYGLI